MAQVLKPEESEKIRFEARKVEDKKILSQGKQGKDFVNTGAGVMPEKVWKNPVGKDLEPMEIE
jgi:hypothetical protein